jgi:hypothetical protein
MNAPAAHTDCPLYSDHRTRVGLGFCLGFQGFPSGTKNVAQHDAAELAIAVGIVSGLANALVHYH